MSSGFHVDIEKLSFHLVVQLEISVKSQVAPTVLSGLVFCSLLQRVSVLIFFISPASVCFLHL